VYSRYSKSLNDVTLQRNGGLHESVSCMKEGAVKVGDEDVTRTQNTVANARCGSRVIYGVHPVVTVIGPISRGGLRVIVGPRVKHAKLETIGIAYAVIIIQNRDGIWQLIYAVNGSVAEALASENVWTGSDG
jgi:hypothetical protein